MINFQILEKSKKDSPKFMPIKTPFLNLLCGSEFLCFLFMNCYLVRKETRKSLNAKWLNSLGWFPPPPPLGSLASKQEKSHLPSTVLGKYPVYAQNDGEIKRNHSPISEVSLSLKFLIKNCAAKLHRV